MNNIPTASIEVVDFTSMYESWQNHQEVTPFCHWIKEEIAQRGYAYIAHPIDQSCFEKICQELGTIESIADLTVDQKRNAEQRKRRLEKGRGNRPSRFQSTKFGFHTDVPIVGIMGFYCRIQDPTDGALQVIDVDHVVDYFSEAERALLETINFKWTIRQDGIETTFECPVLSPGKDHYRLYYAPWLAKDQYREEEEALLKKFAQFVEEMERTQVKAIRTQPKEALFVNNRRVLHGRGPLEEDSPRDILRVRLYA
ncbi:MAG: TauD/TfdA family dioxygenase [Bacteroidota bacterium]